MQGSTSPWFLYHATRGCHFDNYLRPEFQRMSYARTTYGVQGATLDRALYHASDHSSFEEGYVALTRGRHEARIYIVDGTAVHLHDRGFPNAVRAIGVAKF